jgi:ubiquinone/menaquinone biosynthesis C-methylase UbiE
MSWAFAAVYDPFMRPSEEACLSSWRAELLAGASGDVLEIGAGTGQNVRFYPASVARLVLTEPDAAMRARLFRRLPEARMANVETGAGRVGALPYDAKRFDVVVSTLVLCSVPDVARALADVRRVLRPGGRFLFLEHVAADDNPARLAWQRRLEPWWRLVSGDCHLTRRTGEAIREAGFEVQQEKRESVRKALPFVRPSVRGVASR